MNKISYKFERFEGPLDLLLSLVSKNKISIIEINILDLLEQYLEYINVMQINDMNIASEFLEMASRLLYMKSLYLLPKHEHSEVKELEKKLRVELISYKECKELAKKFWNIISFDSYTKKPELIDADMTYKKRHKAEKLLEAYDGIKRNKFSSREEIKKKEDKLTKIISRKIVSVSSKIGYILRSVKDNKEMSYNLLISEQESKSDKIAAFLAVLELIKNKQIIVFDSLGKLWLKFRKKLEI